MLALEGDAVRVTSVRRRLLDARARFRRFVPAGQGLVDALLEERRAGEAQEDAVLGFGGAGLLRAVTEPIRRALPSPRRTPSHGDHACPALAARLGLPAVTADRDWALCAEATGVAVRAIW